MSHDLHQVLTNREVELARLVARGLGTKQVADRLRISAKTVAAHRANIYRKSGVTNVAELIKFLLDARLYDDEYPDAVEGTVYAVTDAHGRIKAICATGQLASAYADAYRWRFDKPVYVSAWRVLRTKSTIVNPASALITRFEEERYYEVRGMCPSTGW